MPTSNYVGTLKINELTTAQYNAAVQSDIISDDDLSFLTDALDEQQTVMPTAEAKYEGQVVQFVGTTDANYTNGYFYKCVSDGATPTPNYSWTRVDTQPTPSGLPDQTGQSGKFLTTDGTDASWSDKPLVNTATGTNSLTILGTATTTSNSINIGGISRANGDYAVVVGRAAGASAGGVTVGNSSGCGGGNVSIGRACYATGTGSIQIGGNGFASGYSNNDANTVKFGNQNGNYEIMSADGTIPTARFTADPVSDGAYIPTVTLNSGVATRSWETPTTVTFRTWGANE